MCALPAGVESPAPLLKVEPRPKPPRHLADLDTAARKAFAAAAGLPGFRADQLARHYFGRLEADPEQMTDLPAATRDEIVEALLPPLLESVEQVDCDGGLTRKSVWRGFDGVLIESVLMRYPERTTLCISSQAGCGMRCPFCATGQGGLQRNLSTAEIVEQVRLAGRMLAAGELAGGPGRISNIVFMGMGEPFINLKAVLAALHRLADPAPAGLGISARNLTVSTVGMVPGIRALTALKMPVRLAISLHAPNDELRNQLVPLNRHYPITEVLRAGIEYAESSGRRLSIEYALMRDINDSRECATELARLVRGKPIHVNLIPLNPTPGSVWTASRPADQDEFVRILESHRVPTTVRDTRGQEIGGACGQLAAATRKKHA